MTKRMFIMLACVVAVVVLLGVIKALQVRTAMVEGPKHAPPPPAVTTLRVQPQKWAPVLSAIGSLKAVNGVLVSTDLAGVISEIAFHSGAEVKKGELLVRLDTEQEEAQLHAAEAKRDFARIDLERKRNLINKKAISTADMDSAESELRQAEATVMESKALIARKHILAPFDGSLGIRQVDLGQFISAGTAMVPLQSLDPIHVEFALPQQDVEALAVGKKLRLRATGLPDEEISGEITAIDSRLDESTRNLMIEGTVANTNHRLRPGMFVTVDVLLPEEGEVLTIPSSSISFAPYGNSVYVIGDGTGLDGKPCKVVKQHFVKLGATRGDQVAVLSGIKAGDEVVTSGVFKLSPEQPVQVSNIVQPGNEAAPTPADT